MEACDSSMHTTYSITKHYIVCCTMQSLEAFVTRIVVTPDPHSSNYYLYILICKLLYRYRENVVFMESFPTFLYIRLGTNCQHKHNLQNFYTALAVKSTRAEPHECLPPTENSTTIRKHGNSRQSSFESQV